MRKTITAHFVTQITAKGCRAFYTTHTERMEAPMNSPVHSQVAIQARIAEWQRHYRNSDHGSVDFLFGGSNSRADHLKWFRHA
jgi:hypothetical protein